MGLSCGKKKWGRKANLLLNFFELWNTLFPSLSLLHFCALKVKEARHLCLIAPHFNGKENADDIRQYRGRRKETGSRKEATKQHRRWRAKYSRLKLLPENKAIFWYQILGCSTPSYKTLSHLLPQLFFCSSFLLRRNILNFLRLRVIYLSGRRKFVVVRLPIWWMQQ